MILPLSITRGLTQHFHRELYNIQKPAGALKRVSQLCTVSLLLSLAPRMLLSIPKSLNGQPYYCRPRELIYVVSWVCFWTTDSESAGCEAGVWDVSISTGHEHHEAVNTQLKPLQGI